MRSVVALIVGLALTLSAAPAQAEPFGPDENTAYEIAVAYWGQAPPLCTSVTGVVEPLQGTEGGEAAPPPYPMACVLKISTAATGRFEILCPTMVHEVGHLEGLGHSSDPANIMFEAITTANVNAVPGCNQELGERVRLERWEARRVSCRSKPSTLCWRLARRARLRYLAFSA